MYEDVKQDSDVAIAQTFSDDDQSPAKITIFTEKSHIPIFFLAYILSDIDFRRKHRKFSRNLIVREFAIEINKRKF